MKIRENIKKEQQDLLHEHLEDVFNSESGFIILCRGNRITDFYQSICTNCVIKKVTEAVNEFDEFFGLPECKSD